jgi:hypothetical protein
MAGAGSGPRNRPIRTEERPPLTRMARFRFAREYGTCSVGNPRERGACEVPRDGEFPGS